MGEMADAMKLALGARKYDKPPVALCPNCEAPLVGTIIFPGAEFYCLDCGQGCSFVSPVEGDPDDEALQEKTATYSAEWKEHVHVDGRELTEESREWLKERQRT